MKRLLSKPEFRRTGFLLTCRIGEHLLRTTIVLIIVLIGYSTTIALAQSKPAMPKGSNNSPIEIFGDKTIADLVANTVELIGNVRAQQGNTAIQADRMKIYYRKGADGDNPSGEETLDKIVASGNVEIKFDNRLAVTQEAVYKVDERLFIMTGPGSKITSGKNSVIGDKITFDRKNDRVKVEGGVKALIFPGEKGLE